jgi:hypothetical protein
MVTLADLGFCQGIICETIICTFNLDGRPNAAPMGVMVIDSQKVSLIVYNSAETLKNLQNTKAATLNLTSDVDFYYKSALKSDKLPICWFEKSNVINAPKLKTAIATVSVSIENFEPIDTIRTKATCNVECIEALKAYPQVYCRAKPAVLEAIIHATRVKALVNVEAEQAHVVTLYSLIQNCIDIVNRSAPNSHYAELMSDLQKKIDSWRTKT